MTPDEPISFQFQVRTKYREFGSVSDLINYHRDNNIPIISNDCEILLQTPILNS